MPDPNSNKEILWGWKAIAEYLDKDIRTLFRWEKEFELPVHRSDPKSKKAKVYAFKAELSEWLKHRENNHKNRNKLSANSKLRWRSILLIFGLTSIILILYFIYYQNNVSQAASQPKPSIGFLHLKPTDPSHVDSCIAEGFRNELIKRIASLNMIRIIPLDPSIELGEERGKDAFHVDYYLSGNFGYENEMLHLQYHIESSSNNRVIVSDDIYDHISNFRGIQDQVCEKIHSILNIDIKDAVAFENSVADFNHNAFTTYLRGKYLLDLISHNRKDAESIFYKGKYYYELRTRESNELAIRIFSDVIALDDSFIPALIGLAQCFLNNINFGWDYNVEWVIKAKDLLSRDNSAYENYPEYFCALTKLYLIQYLIFDENTEAKAYEVVNEGIQRFPNDPNINAIAGFSYFLLYGENGNAENYKKALDFAEKGFWRNPFSTNNLLYTELLMLRGRFEDALKICRVLRQIDPSGMCDFRIGEIYYYSGDFIQSESIFKEIKYPINFEIGSLLYQGMIKVNQGERDIAESIVGRLGNLAVDTLRESHLRLASIHFGLGQVELGWMHLDEFFSYSGISKQKYQFAEYINLDRNFMDYKDSIMRRYYE